MSSPRILFVPDAGPAIGGGHVMRCLALAEALTARGADCNFLAAPAAAVLLETFSPETARTPAASTAASDLIEAGRGVACEAVVFDHYGLAQPEHDALAAGRPTLVADDLADRPLGADLVLDPGPARRAEHYDHLTRDGVRLMLGPEFAPLRPAFAALRETALAWRGEPVQRILVSMGLTDVDGVTARVLERVRPRAGDIGIDVVLGSAAPSLPGLTKVARRDGRLSLHVDTAHMARLTAEADIAVGAAGSSVWERCALGLPSIIVVLAENQRPAARALADTGAALIVDVDAPDFDASLDRGLTRLLSDAALRLDLSRRSAALCDGLGAGRAADALLSVVASRGS